MENTSSKYVKFHGVVDTAQCDKKDFSGVHLTDTLVVFLSGIMFSEEKGFAWPFAGFFRLFIRTKMCSFERNHFADRLISIIRSSRQVSRVGGTSSTHSAEISQLLQGCLAGIDPKQMLIWMAKPRQKVVVTRHSQTSHLAFFLCMFCAVPNELSDLDLGKDCHRTEISCPSDF